MAGTEPQLPDYMAGYQPLFDVLPGNEVVRATATNTPVEGLLKLGNYATRMMFDDSITDEMSRHFFRMVDTLGSRVVAEAVGVNPDEEVRTTGGLHEYPIHYRDRVVERLAAIANRANNLRYGFPPDTTYQDRQVELDRRRLREAAEGYGLDPETTTSWEAITAALDRRDLGLPLDASDELVAETKAARDAAERDAIKKRYEAYRRKYDATPPHLRLSFDPNRDHYVE